MANLRLLERLRFDRKEVFRAAADAQRIADYLLAFHPAYAARHGSAGTGNDGDKGSDAVAATTPSTIPVAEAA